MRFEAWGNPDQHFSTVVRGNFCATGILFIYVEVCKAQKSLDEPGIDSKKINL